MAISFISGIEYLYENGLLQRTPEDVAQFLHKGEGLSKTAIGDYLGERSEFNEAVLRAFVELHDFTDLILVQALRLVIPLLTIMATLGQQSTKQLILYGSMT